MENGENALELFACNGNDMFTSPHIVSDVEFSFIIHIVYHRWEESVAAGAAEGRNDDHDGDENEF